MIMTTWGMAQPARGYIVTKNGQQLTGYIGDVIHYSRASRVVFINDFGSVYEIDAALIRGYVRRDTSRVQGFRSRKVGRRWIFLELVQAGRGLLLYRSPESVVLQPRQANGLPGTTKRYPARYWVQRPGEAPIGLTPLNYRRHIKKLVHQRTPQLAALIGKADYRYSNLPAIVEAYNNKVSRRKWHRL